MHRSSGAPLAPSRRFAPLRGLSALGAVVGLLGLQAACDGFQPVQNDGVLPGDPDRPLRESGDTAETGATDVVINPSNGAPTAVANAEWGGGELVTDMVVNLDGASSTDPDGDTLYYDWRLVRKPTSSSRTITNSSFPQATFVVDAEGDYTIELHVTDNRGGEDLDQVQFTVGSENLPPIADAGIDQSAEVGDSVTLNGTASYDPDDGPGPLEWNWEVTNYPSGAYPSLSGISIPTTAATPRFTPSRGGTYIFELTVGDGELTSPPDYVTVRITDPDAGGGSGGSSGSSSCLDCAADVELAATRTWTAGSLAGHLGTLMLPIFVVLWHRRRDE